tara:strand:+ start:1652 stop:2023 length:372 start_codon:yes stop_codon:yes gene_type:complete
MALERGKLTNVVAVSAGSTVGIVTVASNKKIYIKSIVAAAMGDFGDTAGIQTGKAHVYFVPTNGGSAGTPARSNQIFNIDLGIKETALLEPSYPLVLSATGDSIRVGAMHTTVNFLITGDKES